MHIRLTVFDVAGTTVLDDDAVIEEVQSALAAGSVRVLRPSIKAVMGMPKPAAIRHLLCAHATFAAPEIDHRADEIHSTFMQRVIERYRSDPMIRPVPEAADVFSRLRAAGIRVALDTGFNRAVLDVLLARLGWDRSVVDVTVASDEVEQGRPHPHMIHRAMQLTGVADPLQVAKIGDTPADIEEGLGAGCGLVIGVTYGTHSRVEFERFDVPLIDRLTDLLPLVGAA
jgi:phosphonatase-like hydrolase